jgi:soluble lytic murein transglycosylase-like protein
MRVRRILTFAAPVVLVFAPLGVGANGPSAHSGASPELAELREMVRRISTEQGLDPSLVDAVVRVESAYNPRAVSHKGALGLMQLMPDTARRLEVEDPFDPEQNLRGGMREFSRLIDRYSGSLQLALAAYNAGEGAVERYRGIPPYRETRNYVTRIMTIYTGKPYRLAGGYRISPVRMTRGDDGRTVITNAPASSEGGISISRSAHGSGTLRGGFGNN